VVAGWEEVGRLVVYLVVSIAYVSFWLGLALLFSILFRSLATSALAAVALWGSSPSSSGLPPTWWPMRWRR
jgi:ABC-2 type transport system permease protein